MKLFFKKFNNKKAFTLVETLIALAVFTIAVTAVMAVLASGISSTDFAKKKMTATYLAQEGIEYVRNMRDNYTLDISTTGGWTNFKIKSTTITMKKPTDTSFTRIIKVNPNDSSNSLLNNGQEVKVTSTVSWNQGSGQHSVSFSEDLFNWTNVP